MASAFSDSLIASGGGRNIPRKISGTTNGRTMKFLPDVGFYKEAQNQKKSEKNPEKPDLWKCNF